MNNKVKTALTLAVGAVAGFIVSYKWSERKWSTIAEEDIDSVKKLEQSTRRTFRAYRNKVCECYGETVDNTFYVESESIEKMAAYCENDVVPPSKPVAEAVPLTVPGVPVEFKERYAEHPLTERNVAELPYVVLPDYYRQNADYAVKCLSYDREMQRLYDPDDIDVEYDVRTTLGEDVMDYLTVQWGSDGQDDDTVYVEDDIAKIYYALTIE